MKNATITFQELRTLLLELGFCEAAPEKDRTQFEHPATRTTLLFRPHRSKEAVSDREMLVVRRQLVDNGLIEPSAFDHFLQKATA